VSAGSRQRVASVARALALLDEVARSDAGLGVNELARRIGVNASTASRLLATLEEGGLVERSADGPYRLGLKLVALSDRVLGQLDVRERARPWLTWLVEETGETATLSVPGGGEAITVDFVPSSSSVVSMARVGRPSVAHATAAGKVMLAFGSAGAPGDEARAGELVAFTERTITDPATLAAELDAVRASGIAEAVGEREPDLNALAAPVIGRGGELVAILGLQGPATRLPASTRRALRAPLGRAAAELGRSLGGPG
jgi:DNA-binding IclR family transcriptional regulator